MCRTVKKAMLWSFLNIAFFVFHTSWIVFNCVGWAWTRTRRWQLATISLTALSWFGLGIWYGWGYCPCTDWHWRVRAHLGYVDPPSYVQLLVHEILRLNLTIAQADALAVVVLLAAAILGIVANLRERRRGPGATPTAPISSR